MATEFCPECHQPMRSQEVVCGVRLTTFKTMLFHYIERHPGRSSIEIADHFNRGSRTIISHIGQINDALMNTSVRIRGRQFSGYHIEAGSSA